jgi:hypothetical protein
VGASTISPKDTEWAYGTTANYASLTYQNLKALKGGNFGSIIDGQDLLLHLITDNIYVDINMRDQRINPSLQKNFNLLKMYRNEM